MAKSRQQKTNIIKDVTNDLKAQKAVVLVDFSGTESKKLFELRDNLKKEGCKFAVVKKTLLEKALEGLKETAILEKIKAVKGQIALALGFTDEITPAKLCFQFSRTNENFKLLAGILDNAYLEKDRVLELAVLPSRQELLGKLVYVLSAAPRQFVYVLSGNMQKLVIALNEIQKVRS